MSSKHLNIYELISQFMSRLEHSFDKKVYYRIVLIDLKKMKSKYNQKEKKHLTSSRNKRLSVRQIHLMYIKWNRDTKKHFIKLILKCKTSPDHYMKESALSERYTFQQYNFRQGWNIINIIMTSARAQYRIYNKKTIK